MSQSRQFNVGWNIGFQHLAQMSPSLKAGIESNVANKIVFSLNLDEARSMAKYTLEVSKEDFYSLPPFWAYIRTEISPNTYRWIIGKTYPPSPKLRDSRAPYLSSLTKYGQNIVDIEKELLLNSIKEIATGDDSGDLILFGAILSKNRCVNFEIQYGGHGGIGGMQNKPFIMMKRDLDKDISISDLYSLFQS